MSGLLNTRTATLLELVSNGRIYRVPPYQRDYSWELEHRQRELARRAVHLWREDFS